MSQLSFTFTAPVVFVYIIANRTDAAKRAGGVHASVLAQKLREAAFIQICCMKQTYSAVTSA